jgi:peptidoglycan/xylan/chitin deacetylase (PgdA/CDA1 family)
LAASCAAATSPAWLGAHEARAKVSEPRVARIAITLDLEMSRHFPTWDDMHWDYEKGNLDEPTKLYAVEAARRVQEHGGRIHFFALGRTMEQPDVDWLRGIAAAGHPIGNHTYDHVNVRAKKPEDIQFRFARSPWLIAGREPLHVIADNIRLGDVALRERAGIAVDGFRTPGGFHDGLADRADLQQLLLSQGYRWVSSKYPAHPTTMPGEPVNEEVFAGIVAAQAAAQPFVYPSGLVEIPMSPISDVGALRSARWKLDDFLTAIRRAVNWTIENGAVFDFLAHPSCLIVADPEFRAIELICELVAKSPERAKIVTLSTLAHELQPEIPPAKS